jgi:hypothetical protein
MLGISSMESNQNHPIFWSKILCEAMVVGEHPQAPMNISTQFFLSEEFPFESYLSKNEKRLHLTEKFFKNNPQLVASFNLKKEGTPKEHDDNFQELALKAWSFNHLPIDQFLRQNIDATNAPLIRFKLCPECGLVVLAHHGLTDGRGLFKVASSLTKALLLEEVEKENGPMRELKIPGLTFLKTISQRFHYFKHKLIELLLPPLILGDKEDFSSGPARLHTASVDLQLVKSAFSKTREICHPNMSLNDFLLGVLKKVIKQKFAEQTSGGQKRISILMPMDLRKYGACTEVDNLSSGVSINTFPGDYESDKGLFSAVTKQTKEAKRNSFELKNIKFLNLLKKRGILDQSRSYLVSFGLPRRCFKGRTHFWRFSSTAIFANMGYLKIDPAIRKIVTKINGYPAIIPPTNLGLTSFIYNDLLTLNFHCSGKVLNKEELESLANDFSSTLEKLNRGRR